MRGAVGVEPSESLPRLVAAEGENMGWACRPRCAPRARRRCGGAVWLGASATMLAVSVRAHRLHEDAEREGRSQDARRRAGMPDLDKLKELNGFEALDELEALWQDEAAELDMGAGEGGGWMHTMSTIPQCGVDGWSVLDSTLRRGRGGWTCTQPAPWVMGPSVHPVVNALHASPWGESPAGGVWPIAVARPPLRRGPREAVYFRALPNAPKLWKLNTTSLALDVVEAPLADGPLFLQGMVAGEREIRDCTVFLDDEVFSLGHMGSFVSVNVETRRHRLRRGPRFSAGEFNLVACENGRIYAFHEEFFQEYNLLTDMWSSLPAAPTSLGGRAVACSNNIVYLGGGRKMEDDKAYESEMHAFDVATAAWNAVSPMPEGRSDFSLVPMGDGKLYAIGGKGGIAMTSSSGFQVQGEHTPIVVFVYDIARDAWTSSGAPMLQASTSASATRSGRKIFVFGRGSGALPPQSAEQGTVMVYDPSLG